MSDLPSGLTADSARSALERLINGRDAKVWADLQWLNANHAVVPGAEPLAAQLEAKLLRRNQVLYCVGHQAQEQFRYADIEALVRQRFPNSNQGSTLNVTSALSELADKDIGILARNPDGTAYMLKDRGFRAGIQAFLRCAEGSEAVELQPRS